MRCCRETIEFFSERGTSEGVCEDFEVVEVVSNYRCRKMTGNFVFEATVRRSSLWLASVGAKRMMEFTFDGGCEDIFAGWAVLTQAVT